MKKILFAAIILLGMMSCEKEDYMPLANTSWENNEWNETLVEFNATSVVLSLCDKEDRIRIISDTGLYVQNGRYIDITFNNPPMANIKARLDPYGYLVMHLGTPSEARFAQVTNRRTFK